MATAYATVDDVQARLARPLSAAERSLCESLLEDAAVMIDIAAPNASTDAKKLVSCRMVLRAVGNGDSLGVPIGATQSTTTALGYSQSWTLSGGSAGELYIGKQDKLLLGLGNAIGSASPVEALACRGEATACGG